MELISSLGIIGIIFIILIILAPYFIWSISASTRRTHAELVKIRKLLEAQFGVAAPADPLRLTKTCHHCGGDNRAFDRTCIHCSKPI